MPINDKEDKFQAVGGSHWGLLVYNVEKDNFLYLDSMNNIISNTGSIAAKIKSVKNQRNKSKQPEPIGNRRTEVTNRISKHKSQFIRRNIGNQKYQI